MRIGFVEWPDGLLPHGAQWDEIAEGVATAQPDILITNELPFGDWIAAGGHFDARIADASVALHEQGIAALRALGVPAVISSRPVWEGHRLANEAIVIEGGLVRPVHRKQYFPEEAGWHETMWYGTSARGFETALVDGVTTGVLLCTELMFNEHARAFGRASAGLIAVPRATGLDYRSWHIAGAMAAMVSCSYVVSSNRVGQANAREPVFGGGGFAFAPGGERIATTSPMHPLAVIELDLDRSLRAHAAYPCYVAE